jgi:hypothetical protein
MYGSLIRRAVLLVPALAVAVCARDARVPRFDEKGRDRDELEALNARARIAAESREKERLERRGVPGPLGPYPRLHSHRAGIQ